MCGNFQVRNLELIVLGLAVKRARRNPTCQPLLRVPEEFACMGYTAILFSASLVTFVVDIRYYVLCLCVCVPFRSDYKHPMREVHVCLIPHQCVGIFLYLACVVRYNACACYVWASPI